MADPELEEEIFKLCSDSKCPRDIQFHCEKFTEYAAQEKSGKAEAEGECKRTVKTVLQQHFLEEFQTVRYFFHRKDFFRFIPFVT